MELLQEDIGGNVSESLKEEWQEEFVVFECLHISKLCQQNVGQHFSFLCLHAECSKQVLYTIFALFFSTCPNL